MLQILITCSDFFMINVRREVFNVRIILLTYKNFRIMFFKELNFIYKLTFERQQVKAFIPLRIHMYFQTIKHKKFHKKQNSTCKITQLNCPVKKIHPPLTKFPSTAKISSGKFFFPKKIPSKTALGITFL